MAADPAPPAAGNTYANLQVGDHIPFLRQECGDEGLFAFDAIAGRYHLLGFFLAADTPDVVTELEAIALRRDLFDDRHCSFTGVTVVQRDRPRMKGRIPGVRYAWDFDLAMSRACGAVPVDSNPGATLSARRFWVLVDPSLHVLRIFRMGATPVQEVIDFIAALPPPDRFGGVTRPAPILLLPNVFEPQLCRRLIHLYEREGGLESGIQRDGSGVFDSHFKRRRDFIIEDPGVIQELKARIGRRVLPEIERLFFMDCRYIERHIVGCYSAEDGGHFAPHTDNRPGLTAHRRFAVSINLSEGFEGGEVVFPEYNSQGYKAPPGWAVVFPAAALHAVRRVTKGVRYAYLPFVYDEGGRAIREAEFAKAEAGAPTA